MSTTSFRRGHVVLVPFKYSDKDQYKCRPAIVLAEPLPPRNELLVTKITSKKPLHSFYIEVGIDSNDAVDMGLLTDSFIDVAAVQTITEKLIIKTLGITPKRIMEKILSLHRRRVGI